LPDNGSAFAGTGAAAPTCAGAFGTTQTRAQADADLLAWHNLLVGAAEALGANQVGAMIGARGCVSLDTTVNRNTYGGRVAGPGVPPAVNPTAVAPNLPGATGRFGSDLQRRVLSVSFPLACLNC